MPSSYWALVSIDMQILIGSFCLLFCQKSVNRHWNNKMDSSLRCIGSCLINDGDSPLLFCRKIDAPSITKCVGDNKKNSCHDKAHEYQLTIVDSESKYRWNSHKTNLAVAT